MLYQTMNNGSMTKKMSPSSSTKSIILSNDSNRKVKNLLLQGWRSRWSSSQFATYLKQQLSIVSQSGDNYELSKLILQQATVGRQPVILFIDYLHHLLACGVVSFSSVINSIIETCKIENTQVVICLLDFLISQENNLNCLYSANDQDYLNLAISLTRLVNFVFNCLEFSLKRLNELITSISNNQQNQHEQSIDKCSQLLTLFIKNQLLISLIYVGLIDESQTNNLKLINFSDIYEQKDKLFARLPNNNTNKNQLNSSFQNIIIFIDTLNKFNPNLQSKKCLQLKSDPFKYRNTSQLDQQQQQQKLNNNKSDDELSIITTEHFDDHLKNPLISLNCVVTFDALLNAKTPSSKLAHQLYDISIANHLKLSLICCELIKCSFINFFDSLDHEQSNSLEKKFLNQFQNRKSLNNNIITKESVKWAAFIYFKMPLVLKCLKELANEKNQPFELERGLEKLIKFTPLIETLDYKTDSDCLANLLIKLVKLELIDEKFQQQLLIKKDEQIEYFNNLNSKVEKDVFKKQTENLVQIQGQILLNNFEPSIRGIFSSLNPDVGAKWENLIQVFVKVISGNSIEIILNTSTYTGQLHTLTKKIIHCNEVYTQASSGENPRQASLRANLFDISFLVLCYIVQEHGQEIILNCLEEEGVDLNSTKDDMEIDEKAPTEQQNTLANSFFVKFCLDYLPENLCKVNYDEKLAKNIDTNKVDGLLSIFSMDNFDYQLIKWNEVLFNVIVVFKELVQAYLNNYLTFDELSVYMLNMIKRNCSISVVIAFYTVNLMNTVDNEQKKKIILIINYLTNSNNFVSCFANQTDEFANYREKHNLALKIINNLINDQIPKTIIDHNQNQQKENNNLIQSSSSPLNNDHQQQQQQQQQIELYKVLRSAFLNTIKKGWLSTSSIYCFDKILSIGGSTWFMDKLIKLLLYDCKVENLFEGVELIYGLSTLNMEQCCLALLNVVLPQYLVSFNDQPVLFEPKLTALCKLISSIIYSVLELNNCRSSSSSSSSSKLQEPIKTIQSTVHRHSSHYVEDSFVQYENYAHNYHQHHRFKSNEDKTTPIEFISSNNNLNDYRGGERRELLFNSISRLLRLVSSLLNESNISQRTIFSLILLEQLVYIFPSTSDDDQTEHSSSSIKNHHSTTNDIHKLISSALNSKVQIILQYLPFDTILNLVKIFPNEINYDFLLSICNLQSTTSRKLTAKSLYQLSRSKSSICYSLIDPMNEC